MSERKCWGCEKEPPLPGQNVCAKCELANRTCAICGKVYERRDSEGFDFYGVPYCLEHLKERKQPGYRSQNGCHNCASVFCQSEYDDGDSLFCTFGAPPRPLCGSVLMGEQFGGFLGSLRNPEKHELQGNNWDIWSLGRQVVPEGICDNWKLKGES